MTHFLFSHQPENLLSAGSDENEMIKIADFGFSKNFGEEKLMTSCGSPGYVGMCFSFCKQIVCLSDFQILNFFFQAPEVLTCESYDKSVDMWSIGVILYILLCGYPPFYADNAPALFKKIMDVQYDFDDPSWDDVSQDAKDLIKALLVKEPKNRLTAVQVLEHPWVVVCFFFSFYLFICLFVLLLQQIVLPCLVFVLLTFFFFRETPQPAN